MMLWKWSKTRVETATPQTNNKIVVCYHQTDHALACVLDTQFQILSLKLPFTMYYFQYPSPIPTFDPEKNYYLEELRVSDQKAVQDYQASYQQLLAQLANPALFVPFISPLFLKQLWKDIKCDEKLNTCLSQPQLPIAPVLLRPVIGVSPRYVAQPLAAYEGYALEQACSQVVAGIEQTLMQLYRPSLGTKTPLALLEAPHQRALALR